MVDWQDGFAVDAPLTLDDITGFLFGDSDPTVSEPGINIPKSAIFIRTEPPQVWQKQSNADLDWTLLGECKVIQVPELYLPFLMSDGSEIALPLDTDMTLPFLMSDGSEIGLSLGV